MSGATMKPVHNTHEQVGHGGVYITYAPAHSVFAGRARVHRVGYKTDPKPSIWYDYGNKAFLGKMEDSVPEAKAWAGQRYGITKWRRNGMGDWVDANADLPPLLREIERKTKAKAA